MSGFEAYDDYDGLGLAELGDRVLGDALSELRAAAHRGHVDDFVLRRGERLADLTMRNLIDLIPQPSEGAPSALVAGGPGRRLSRPKRDPL